MLEQRASDLGRGRRGKTRARAPVRIRSQRELWNEEQSAADVTHRAVHPAFFIGEYSITQQPLEQAIRLSLLIACFDTDEHQQAAADRGDDRPVHRHAGAGNALQEPDHRLRHPKQGNRR